MTLEDVFNQIVAAGWGTELIEIRNKDGISYRVVIAKNQIFFCGNGADPVAALDGALKEYSQHVQTVATLAPVVQQFIQD